MKTLPLAEMKAKFSALLSEVENQHDQITVTRNGVPSAVVVSMHEWESLQETLALLSDQEAVSELKEAEESIAAGELYSTADVLAEFAERRSQSV